MHYSRWRRLGSVELEREPGKCKRGHLRTPQNVYPSGDCRACTAEKTKAWRSANPERARQMDRARYSRTRDKRLAQKKAWRDATPEKQQEQGRRDRAKRAAANVELNRRRRLGGRDADTIDYVWILRSDPCSYCGGVGGEVDHVDPSAAGGPNHWTNYSASCRSCNASKKAEPLLAFLVKGGLRRPA